MYVITEDGKEPVESQSAAAAAAVLFLQTPRGFRITRIERTGRLVATSASLERLSDIIGVGLEVTVTYKVLKTGAEFTRTCTYVYGVTNRK